MKIAIAGKGGVGKTTLAAGLAKLFAQRGFEVYAVDADPDVSLGTTLGVPESQLSAQPPMLEMKELIAERTGGGGLMYILNPEVDDILEQYAINVGKIKLLRMGAVKHASSACYCPENAFLNAAINSLLLGNRQIVILDLGAGIEQLTRGTTRGVDMLLVVTEPTRVSVDTAHVIQKLAGELNAPRVRVVGNKVRSAKEREFLASSFAPGELLGCLDFDETLWERAMMEDPQGLEEVLLHSVRQVFDQILQEVGEATGQTK